MTAYLWLATLSFTVPTAHLQIEAIPRDGDDNSASRIP